METPIQHSIGPADGRGPAAASGRGYRSASVIAFFIVVSFIGGVVLGEVRVTSSARGFFGIGGTATDTAAGQVTGRDTPAPYELKDVDFKQFWNIWQMVKDRSVQQPVSDVKMFYGAISGMVASLGDPYSVYFDPETAKKFSSDLEGTFDGIGAEIGSKQDALTVIAPLPGTPAEKAGLKAGDKVLAIDGIDTSGMLVDEAVTRIRGVKGTTVKLLIMRDGLKAPKEISIVRDTIVVESVTWKTVKSKDGKKIGLITITHFNETTDAKFNTAVRTVLADNPAGVILDLRNDPGGYLDSAVTVAGEWIDKDTVVFEKFSDGKQTAYPSKGGSRLGDMPTVVLVNGGSASASEIVSGALQDDGKAILVGEKTFGKGSVQDYQEFDDGSALKLTIALWLTPKGRSINKEGIVPDVEVKLTPEDYDAGKDPQMDKAIELLAAPGGLPKHVDHPATTAAAPASGKAKTP